MKIACAFMVVALAVYAEAYSEGAPTSACKDMIPRHPVEPKKTPAPYIVTTNTKVVKAGTPLEVTISGKTPKDTIKGLMLQARVGDQPVGTFKLAPNEQLVQLLKCSNAGVLDVIHDFISAVPQGRTIVAQVHGPNSKLTSYALDTVTHKKHDASLDRQTITLTWVPPADLNDEVKFRATIALNGAVFWVGVESAPIKVSL